MWLKRKDRQTTLNHADEHGHPHEEPGISRRRFLIGTVAGVAGFALSRFLPPLPGVSSLMSPHETALAGPTQPCGCGCDTSFSGVFCECRSECGYCDAECETEYPDAHVYAYEHQGIPLGFDPCYCTSAHCSETLLYSCNHSACDECRS